MVWVRISVETSHESEDALSDLFIEMGSGGAQIEDDSARPDKIVVSAYFPPDDMIGERVSRITALLKNMRKLNMNVGAGRVLVKRLDETEWTKPWQEFFKPMPVGERILVYPSWEDAGESVSRDVLIQIDPEMAFGTGRHSTTMLCLELLEDVLTGGEKVADVGTGSGILAIAAIKLGAYQVTAIDIDPKAVAIAKKNTSLNGVDDKIHVICGESLSSIDSAYDVVVCNIVSKVIFSMIPDFGDHLKVDGRLILSGILANEAAEIQKELEQSGLSVLESRFHEEWAAILARACM